MPQAFEDMFFKWDVSNSGSLSAWELWKLISGNRLAVDPYGVCVYLDFSAISLLVTLFRLEY